MPGLLDHERGIRAIYRTFAREGVLSFSSSFRSPGYATLMTLTDGAGKNWSYLATKESYDRIRTMHQQNLIVPVVGDFAGQKAIRAVGQYLRAHGTTVHVFYLSNVEDYIQARAQYVGNLASQDRETRLAAAAGGGAGGRSRCVSQPAAAGAGARGSPPDRGAGRLSTR